MRLSQNFTLDEMLKSQTALRLGLDNTPSPDTLENLKALAANVLQPVRDKFGPVTITSGYRSTALNKKIGGSKTSQHLTGEAADFEVIGTSNYDVACWIRDNIEFDQLILECYTPGEPNSGWIHVSYRHAPRYSVLTFDGKNYLNGLVK